MVVVVAVVVNVIDDDDVVVDIVVRCRGACPLKDASPTSAPPIPYLASIGVEPLEAILGPSWGAIFGTRAPHMAPRGCKRSIWRARGKGEVGYGMF